MILRLSGEDRSSTDQQDGSISTDPDLSAGDTLLTVITCNITKHIWSINSPDPVFDVLGQKMLPFVEDTDCSFLEVIFTRPSERQRQL